MALWMKNDNGEVVIVVTGDPDLLKEDDDHTAHGVSKCPDCPLPPHGAMVLTICGKLARIDTKGEPCQPCIDVMGGKQIRGKQVVPCWRCGRKPGE